jgi:N-carbamoylputrescine amidase
MALAGAEILIYPTAIGWDDSDTAEEQQRQLDAWITVQRGHSVANGLPLICCNRVGTESDPEAGISNHFWGHSFVTGPQGEFLAQADNEEEMVLFATIDMDKSEAVRRIWPFLRDRRIDAYDSLQKRFND